MSAADKIVALDKLKQDQQLLWPMLPGDTLEALANTLYPQSPILRKRFLQKVFYLNRDLNLGKDAQQPFQRARFIRIPNEKAVRELTHRIKPFDAARETPTTMNMSYQLNHWNGAGKADPSPSTTIQAPTKKQDITARNSSNEPALPVWQTLYPEKIMTGLALNLTERMSLLSARSLAVTQQAKGYTSTFWQRLKADTQFRNLLLMGFLILLLLGFWWLHRRHIALHRAKLEAILSNNPD